MDRRTFVHAAVTTAAACGLTGRFGAARAETAIIPVLSLLEDASREELPQKLVHLIRDGLSYDQLLTALSLAAVRNVQPYPDVGFKYHAVMVLQSVHLTALHLPGMEKWLPLIWAADNFKRSQADERRASGWRMSEATDKRNAVRPDAARRALIAALESWDGEAADAAVTSYTRAAAPKDVLSLLFSYGARDLRAIGHKAITVQNAHRIIGADGYSHALSVLRSTVAALQNAGSDPDPTTRDLAADRPWRRNNELLHEIPAAWKQGRMDQAARADLLVALREVSQEDAGEVVVKLLRAAISPETIWQALFDAAAELVMRLPSIVSLHARTTANALNYAYRMCEDEGTQQLMLLQCAAFIPMFRGFVGGARPSRTIDDLQPVPPEEKGLAAVEEIFADLSVDRFQAASKTHGYLREGGDLPHLLARARHYLVRHASDAHDYKFLEGVLEDCSRSADDGWRHRHVSAAMVYFKGPASRPHPVVAEAAKLLGAGIDVLDLSVPSA